MKGLFGKRKYVAIITNLDQWLVLRDMDYMVELITNRASEICEMEKNQKRNFILSYKARPRQHEQIVRIFENMKPYHPGMTITYLTK